MTCMKEVQHKAQLARAKKALRGCKPARRLNSFKHSARYVVHLKVCAMALYIVPQQARACPLGYHLVPLCRWKSCAASVAQAVDKIQSPQRLKKLVSIAGRLIRIYLSLVSDLRGAQRGFGQSCWKGPRPPHAGRGAGDRLPVQERILQSHLQLLIVGLRLCLGEDLWFWEAQKL